MADGQVVSRDDGGGRRRRREKQGIGAALALPTGVLVARGELSASLLVSGPGPPISSRLAGGRNASAW